MNASLRLDLRPLYQRPLLQTRRAVHAHEALRRVLAGHSLRWGQGRVDTRLFLQPLGQVVVMALGYGAEVEIEAEPFDGFSLVQMPLRGSTEFYADDIHLTTHPGEVAVLAPRRSEKVLWQAGCEQLLVKVPHALVQRAAFDLAGSEREAGPPVRLASACTLPAELVPAWQALVQQWLAALVAQAAGQLQPEWLRYLDSAAGMFLALHARESVGEVTSAAPQDRRRRQAGGRHWRRLEAVVGARLAEAVCLEDLAGEVGLSPSALTRLCRRYGGVTPMEYLRGRRLDAARRWLLDHPGGNVTEAALSHGFSHLGRFASYYQLRFGERPSETATRGCGLAPCDQTNMD